MPYNKPSASPPRADEEVVAPSPRCKVQQTKRHPLRPHRATMGCPFCFLLPHRRLRMRAGHVPCTLFLPSELFRARLEIRKLALMQASPFCSGRARPGRRRCVTLNWLTYVWQSPALTGACPEGHAVLPRPHGAAGNEILHGYVLCSILFGGRMHLNSEPKVDGVNYGRTARTDCP